MATLILLNEIIYFLEVVRRCLKVTLQFTDKLHQEIFADVDEGTINHVKQSQTLEVRSSPKWFCNFFKNKYPIKALDFMSFFSSSFAVHC